MHSLEFPNNALNCGICEWSQLPARTPSRQMTHFQSQMTKICAETRLKRQAGTESLDPKATANSAMYKPANDCAAHLVGDAKPCLDYEASLGHEDAIELIDKRPPQTFPALHSVN